MSRSVKQTQHQQTWHNYRGEFNGIVFSLQPLVQGVSNILFESVSLVAETILQMPCTYESQPTIVNAEAS